MYKCIKCATSHIECVFECRANGWRSTALSVVSGHIEEVRGRVGLAGYGQVNAAVLEYFNNALGRRLAGEQVGCLSNIAQSDHGVSAKL